MKKITLSNFKLPLLGFAAATFLFGAEAYAQPYINGNLSTGSVSKSGVSAPAGYTWSEVQNIPGEAVSNATTGVGAQIAETGGNRVADNFIVPAGETWTISKMTFYAYQTGYAGTTSPFTDIRVRIQNAAPNSGSSMIVFGDLTTNVMTATSDAMIYRIPNTTTPAGTAPAMNRKIWKIEATVNAILSEGNYWVEWQQLATGGSNFSPPSTVIDVRTMPGYNALQWLGDTSVWNPLVDTGNPATADDVALDMPFKIDYTVQSMAVSEKSFSAGISVFPNPARNTLNITSETVLENAEIYDVTGRLVKSIKFNGMVTNTINVNSLSGGNYIVKLKSGDNVVARKFIKQ